MTTQPTPRFKSLADELNRFNRLHRAIALCDALHEGWDDPEGWDYGLSPDELGDRKRDGYKVEDLYGSAPGCWRECGFSEEMLRTLPAFETTHFYRASKQPSPPPGAATENVMLHKVIGRDVLEGGEWKQVAGVMYAHARHGWQYVTRGGCWRPLPVDDLGTVTVLAPAPAATSDKGAS